MSATRLLLVLGGTLALLLVVLVAFQAWGPGTSQAGRVSASPAAAERAQAAARYAPKDVVVTQGQDKGELDVSWSMPIRPDVVATVIYEGAGAVRARTIVNYHTSPKAVAQATLHGLPAGQEVCLSAAHLVSLGDSITNALSSPVCAVPR